MTETADPTLTEAEVAKLRAEAKTERSNQRKLNAEAQKLKAESREARAKAAKAVLDAVKAQETRKAELASDLRHHIYRFTKDVNEESVKKCIHQLAEWRRLEPGCDIEIVFFSPGGSIFDGMALFDYIQETRRAGHYVTTSALGMAASMAGILLQAGDERVMARESWLLIHEASFAAMGKFGEVEDRVELVKRVQERILDIFASRSNLDKETLRERWLRRDWWLSSDEALEYGLVDSVR